MSDLEKKRCVLEGIKNIQHQLIFERDEDARRRLMFFQWDMQNTLRLLSGIPTITMDFNKQEVI